MGDKLKNPFSQQGVVVATAAPNVEEDFLAFSSSTPVPKRQRGNSWGFFNSGQGHEDRRSHGHHRRSDRFAGLGADSMMTPGRGRGNGSPSTPRGNNRGPYRNWNGGDQTGWSGPPITPNPNDNRRWQQSPAGWSTPQNRRWGGPQHNRFSNSGPLPGRGGPYSPGFRNHSNPRFGGPGRGREGRDHTTPGGYFKPSMLEDPWARLTAAGIKHEETLENNGSSLEVEPLASSLTASRSMSDSLIPQVGDSIIERVADNSEKVEEEAAESSSWPSGSDSMIPMVGDSLLDQDVSMAKDGRSADAPVPEGDLEPI